MEWQAEVIITLKIIFQKRPEYYKIIDTKTEYYKLHKYHHKFLKLTFREDYLASPGIYFKFYI